MRIVLDTNIVISALLNAYGPSAQIMSLLLAGELSACCDSRIFQEYKAVLSRPKFHFPAQAIDDFLDFIESEASWTTAKPLKLGFIDKSDEMFLEVAIAAKADYLITGNLRHFTHTKPTNIQILSPGKFIQIYRVS